jgi:hypothetical protein
MLARIAELASPPSASSVDDRAKTTERAAGGERAPIGGPTAAVAEGSPAGERAPIAKPAATVLEHGPTGEQGPIGEPTATVAEHGVVGDPAIGEPAVAKAKD